MASLKGGGVGRLMANAILNFHFDFLNPSLRFHFLNNRSCNWSWIIEPHTNMYTMGEDLVCTGQRWTGQIMNFYHASKRSHRAPFVINWWPLSIHDCTTVQSDILQPFRSKIFLSHQGFKKPTPVTDIIKDNDFPCRLHCFHLKHPKDI